MQIHEITEGLLGDFARGVAGITPAAQAAKSAKSLAAQGYGPGAPKPSDRWEDKYKAIQQDPGVKQYAANIAQSWIKNSASFVQPVAGLTTSTTLQQVIPTLVTAARKNKNTLTSTQIGQILAKAAPTIWNNTKDKSAAIGQLTKALSDQGVTVGNAISTPAVTPASTVRPKYGKPTEFKIGSAPKPGAPTPAEYEKLQQQIASKLNEATSPADTQYLNAFKKWSDQQLATKVPGTGETVTMDKVEQLPGLGEKLTQLLNQIVQTKGTPEQTQAIQEYIKLAVAGVQAVAQTSKNQHGTQQTSLGIGSQQLAQLKALSKTPQGKDMLKRELGL